MGGSIVPETFRERENYCTLCVASLGSYDRCILGAIVPVTESDERLQKGQQLNRWERRELANRLSSADPGW